MVDIQINNLYELMLFHVAICIGIITLIKNKVKLKIMNMSINNKKS